MSYRLSDWIYVLKNSYSSRNCIACNCNVRFLRNSISYNCFLKN